MKTTTFEIVESTYEPTPDAKGARLRCLTQVVGGADEGRLAYLSFTLEHADKSQQQRGQRAFAALRRATGVLHPQDSSELHYRTFTLPFCVEQADLQEAA